MQEDNKVERIQERTPLDLSTAGNEMWLLKISSEMKNEWFGENSKTSDLGSIEAEDRGMNYFPNPEFKQLPKKIKINLESVEINAKKGLDNQLKVFSMDESGKYRADGRIPKRGIIGGLGENLENTNTDFMKKYIDQKILLEKKKIEGKKKSMLLKEQDIISSKRARVNKSKLDDDTDVIKKICLLHIFTLFFTPKI